VSNRDLLAKRRVVELSAIHQRWVNKRCRTAPPAPPRPRVAVPCRAARPAAATRPPARSLALLDINAAGAAWPPARARAPHRPPDHVPFHRPAPARLAVRLSARSSSCDYDHTALRLVRPGRPTGLVNYSRA